MKPTEIREEEIAPRYMKLEKYPIAEAEISISAAAAGARTGSASDARTIAAWLNNVRKTTGNMMMPLYIASSSLSEKCLLGYLW
tara:strand:+ start:1470 stop:1721 length:252 start_codon:yes stop_codon:yes gene_type:complete